MKPRHRRENRRALSSAKAIKIKKTIKDEINFSNFMQKNRKKKEIPEYTFIMRSQREEQAFASFAVPFQHFLRKELKKNRTFSVSKIVEETINALEEDYPGSLIVKKKK